MQARREAVRFSRSPEPDARVIMCDRTDIALRSMSGEPIDINGALEYEFVRFNRATSKVIIAVFVGDRTEGAPVRLDKQFPNMKRGEALSDDRVFLVGQPAEKWIISHLLAPTGADAHADFGCNASPSYLAWLLHEARS